MDDVKSLSHSKFRCKYQNLYSQEIEKGVGMGDHNDSFGGRGQ